MYQRVVILVIFLMLLSLVPCVAQDAWVARDGAVKNTELKGAVFSAEAFYVATKNVLYRVKDIKERWEPVFSLPQGGSNEITCVAGRNKALFIGTKRGLFRSDDYGQRWVNVFRTILPDKNNITYIELSRHNRSRILIATEKGIFSSEDSGARWQDISVSLKNTSVKCLALNKEYMYAGTQGGLYSRKSESGDWNRMFIRSAPERKSEEGAEEEMEADGPEQDASIRAIAVDNGRVYAGFRKKIIYSDDQGKCWGNFSCDGLRGEINHILISAKNKKIFCATGKGVFEFDSQKSRWLELYKGMAKSAGVNRLIFGSDDETLIFAVTDRGLYSLQSGDYLSDKYPDIEKSLGALKIGFDNEPTYKELQQAAIRYAEVGPEKIKRWRAEAKVRALLPKVSFGVDKNRTDNYEIYTSATKDYIVTGPDDTSDGWNAGLSWELGDLIWSDDQTNIDVRSRLMVQLRNDILDDLRRAYYERKRVQSELIMNPPKDLALRFERELRLQELTQAIDDLTGNYLSEHLRKERKEIV